MPDSRDKVNSVLRQFGDNIGIPNLKLDEEDNCELCIDDQMTVDLEFATDRGELVLSTVVGQVTEINRLEICETFLEANLFWRGTHGATVGLSREADLLYLCDKVAADTLCLEVFESMLDRFISTAEAWSRALDALHRATMKTIPQEEGAIRV